MNDSPQKIQRERIKRFQEVIWEQFKCKGEYVHKNPEEEFCKRFLPQHGAGLVLTFELSQPPREYPEAEQCYVWDGKDFRPGENAVIIVFDVQVLEDDPKELPFAAVRAWLENSISDKPIHWVKSKWSKDQLHGKLAERQFPAGGSEIGRFFVRKRTVRERADGEIVVQIAVHFDTGDFYLSQGQVDTIEEWPELKQSDIKFFFVA